MARPSPLDPPPIKARAPIQTQVHATLLLEARWYATARSRHGPLADEGD